MSTEPEKSRFNLITEPWIPVCYLDGRREELGIRDTLLNAKEIAVIEDPSPLVVAALYRFLLAVLYRALEGPTDIDKAKELFKSGIPCDKIKAYFEMQNERFWLFDEKYPFFQIPDFEPKIWRAWTTLAAEHNADNAKVLFDHIDVTQPGFISAAAAARWLLAVQTFSVSAGKSELSHTGTAPSATAALVLPIGQNLQDTLLLNLVPQNGEVIKNDLPIWEREPEARKNLETGPTRAVAGFADRYTWRTRSIRFKEQSQDNAISELAFASGVKNDSEDSLDPMVAYRVDEKKGKLPRQFSERGIWRDFDSLLPDSTRLAPAVIEYAVELTRKQRERFPHSVMTLGLSNVPGQAKIKFWRMERFVLPQALLSDRAIRTEIRQLLADAEDAQKSLWQASRSFARDVLSRGEREPDKKDVSKFVEQMAVSAAYWSILEAEFHGLLQSYTLNKDPDAIRFGWLKAVRNALRDAWYRHAAFVSGSDAWAIRALVKAESAVNKKLKALNDEIKKYEQHEKMQEESV